MKTNDLVLLSVGLVIGLISGAGFFLLMGGMSCGTLLYRTCIQNHPVAECQELKP